MAVLVSDVKPSDAFLALASAFSLPSIPLWPTVYCIISLYLADFLLLCSWFAILSILYVMWCPRFLSPELKLPVQWKIHNEFHSSLLLPYHETKEHGHNFAEPPSELIKGQPEWEVEEILNSR
jgi:hypothetical protein